MTVLGVLGEGLPDLGSTVITCERELFELVLDHGAAQHRPATGKQCGNAPAALEFALASAI